MQMRPPPLRHFCSFGCCCWKKERMASVDHGRFAALRRISTVASVARSFPVPSSKSACSCRPQLNVFRHDARAHAEMSIQYATDNRWMWFSLSLLSPNCHWNRYSSRGHILSSPLVTSILNRKRSELTKSSTSSAETVRLIFLSKRE